MESDWNQDQVIQLIDLYRERPVLWDPGCADYKDRNLKNYAWSEIAFGMRMTKIEVQDKMKKVIGQFQRENKKTKKWIWSRSENQVVRLRTAVVFEGQNRTETNDRGRPRDK